jgi:hypothetical protein
VDKEDIIINTRLVLAKPVNELGTKREGHRGEMRYTVKSENGEG